MVDLSVMRSSWRGHRGAVRLADAVSQTLRQHCSDIVADLVGIVHMTWRMLTLALLCLNIDVTSARQPGYTNTGLLKTENNGELS